MNKRILMFGKGYSRPFTEHGDLNVVSYYSYPKHILQYKYVVFTGGSDIGPNMYNELPNGTSYVDAKRDAAEYALMKRCVDLGIPTVGICRGMQMQTIYNGGKLIQDMLHHNHNHPISTLEGGALQVNSLHHQLCVPEGYVSILAWFPTTNTCLHRLYNGIPAGFSRKEYLEPEALWFPKTKCLGVQYHPEMMNKDTEGYQYFQYLLNRYIE